MENKIGQQNAEKFQPTKNHENMIEKCVLFAPRENVLPLPQQGTKPCELSAASASTASTFGVPTKLPETEQTPKNQ